MTMKRLVGALLTLLLLAGCGPAAQVNSSTAIHAHDAPAPGAKPAPHAHRIEYVATPGQGGERLAYTLDNGVKVFEIEAREVEWEVTPGKKVTAWTYGGTVPGPEIRVTEGERVRLVIKNSLPEATSLHPHGLKVPPSQDGVPGLGGARAIEPGETGIMEFVATPAGTHWYHSHVNSTEQVNRGMYGPFIVEPKEPEPVTYDRDYTVMIGDAGDLGFVLNGKGYPSAPPIDVKTGERVRVRFVGTGLMVHPMHLHGHSFNVIARDGYPLASPYELDTLTVAPGETWDVELIADNPGTWFWHCHILSHAETKDGMYGLTMLLRYLDAGEEFPAPMTN